MAPPSIDATVGSASANSYVTEAGSDTIAGALWPPATRWSSAKAERRIPCLIQAAAVLDTLRFPGARVDGTQLRAWPRLGVKKPSGYFEYSATEIPEPIQRAQVLLAVWLEEFGETEGGQAGLTSISLGSEISMAFAGDAPTGIAGFLLETIYPVLGALVLSPQPRMRRG